MMLHFLKTILLSRGNNLKVNYVFYVNVSGRYVAICVNLIQTSNGSSGVHE